MECTVIEEAYMGLRAGKETEEIFLKLKKSFLHEYGYFTFLWHYSYFLKNYMQNFPISIAVKKSA